VLDALESSPNLPNFGVRNRPKDILFKRFPDYLRKQGRSQRIVDVETRISARCAIFNCLSTTQRLYYVLVFCLMIHKISWLLTYEAMFVNLTPEMAVIRLDVAIQMNFGRSRDPGD
jgi:hypothetical protein